MSQRPPVTGFERADFKITAPKMDSGAARETFFQSRAMCRVEYASQLDPEFTRTFDVPFRLTVHPCLQMESCVVEKSSLSICVTNHLQEAALLKIHWTVEGALSSRREPLDDLDKIGKGCTNTVRVPLPRGIKKKFAEALEAAWHSEPAGGGRESVGPLAVVVLPGALGLALEAAHVLLLDDAAVVVEGDAGVLLGARVVLHGRRALLVLHDVRVRATRAGVLLRLGGQSRGQQLQEADRCDRALHVSRG